MSFFFNRIIEMYVMQCCYIAVVSWDACVFQTDVPGVFAGLHVCDAVWWQEAALPSHAAELHRLWGPDRPVRVRITKTYTWYKPPSSNKCVFHMINIFIVRVMLKYCPKLPSYKLRIFHCKISPVSSFIQFNYVKCLPISNFRVFNWALSINNFSAQAEGEEDPTMPCKWIEPTNLQFRSKIQPFWWLCINIY